MLGFIRELKATAGTPRWPVRPLHRERQFQSPLSMSASRAYVRFLFSIAVYLVKSATTG
jgi:hypothetical protein